MKFFKWFLLGAFYVGLGLVLVAAILASIYYGFIKYPIALIPITFIAGCVAVGYLGSRNKVDKMEAYANKNEISM